MDGPGMVAVVRGLKDAGLAVTLLDNGKQYTLMPNSETKRPEPTRVQYSAATNCMGSGIGCDMAAQATDGRYASVYKTTHCKMNPTSPPPLLTEFPPQRTSVCRGRDNFIVGGTGSGDTSYNPIRGNGSFRGGGMCWTDRGSVFSPRPSEKLDAFANSLRKYPPSLSPDRSTEIVERLINYTQAKNFKNQRYQYSSPTRSNLDQLDFDVNPRVSKARTYDSEIKEKQRTDECPIRGPRRDPYNSNYDVRYIREMSKKVRDNIRGICNCPIHQPPSNTVRERYQIPTPDQRRHDMGIPCTVNTETQAAARMVCREVATTPGVESPKRNVAVPISPSPSDDIKYSEGQVSNSQKIKSVQTSQVPDNPKKIRKSVQTTLSSIELVNKCRFRNVRMSKSEDELGVNDEDFRVEVLQWLHNVFHSYQYDESMKDVFDKFDAKLKQLSKMCDKSKVKLSAHDFNKDWAQNAFKDITEHANDLSFFQNRFYTDVYRAEVIPFKVAEAKIRNDIIKDWLNKIPLKSHDFLERPVERDKILNSIANKLKDILATTPEFVKKKLKSEVIDMLNEMPFDIKGSNNKCSYLNMITSSLIDRLCRTIGRNNVNLKSVYCNIPNRVQFKSDLQPTENELKSFINVELADIFEKSRIEISNQQIEQIETKLFDIIIDDIAAIKSNQDGNVIAKIVTLLKQSAGLFEHQAMYVTNLLLEHLRQMMINATEEPRVSSIPNRLETVMMIQNSTMNSLNDSSIAGITEGDIEANLNYYIEQLSQQIDEWLTGLRILNRHEPSFRKVVVNDLAGDIVDRHKYLEMNPSSQGTEEEELEHLKFQIFKWINKLVGENHTETIENAPDLMRRIRSVPIPMLTRPGVGYNTSYSSGNVSQMPMFGLFGKGGSMMQNRPSNAVHVRFSGPGGYASGPMYDSVNVGQSGLGGSMIEQQRMAASGRSSSPGAMAIPARPGSRNQSVHHPKTMQELNNEFDDFVKQWVQEIPIATASPEEQELLPTMRAGLYNGVWRAITKLKCQPNLLYNPFYFEDKLDDEIEALFAMVPQTSKFESNRHKLKVKLIEKTTHINDQIKNAAQSESFKQRLIDNLEIYIPRLETNEVNEDPIRLHEELEILYLAEEYILYRRFKDEDPVKAAIYRNKLLKMVQDLVQEVKRSHGREMKDINPDLYANDIITALQQVPVPSDETIKHEADQILLGIEINKWYDDLPIARNNDLGEQLKRRRLRDALGRKIYEMERSMDFSDSNDERVLKHEVSRFLERVPLGRDETLNINFMVDELANRIKNRPRAPDAGKKGIFHENTVDYQNFSRNVETCEDKCSSRIQEALANTSQNLSAQLNQSSYPPNPVVQSPGKYSSLNATAASFNRQPDPYPPNTSVQSPGGYTVFDQHRPVSSSLNALPGEAQYYSQAALSPGQASILPGQTSMLPSGPTDQSGPWMSLYETGTGPGLGVQNISGAQPIPQPALQSFGSYPNYSSVQPRAPNSMVQGPMGYKSFDEERPVSSPFNPQNGGVEYFSIAGSSGQSIRGAGPAAMVQSGQNISSHLPQASVQSPAQASSRNLSERQWLSLYHTGSLPSDQSMAGQNISSQAQSMRQASHAQQSFKEATIPNNSFFPPPNTIVQSPRAYQSFNQERRISSSFNPQDSDIQHISMLPASFHSQTSMMQPGMSVQGQSILANQNPQMSRGASPQEILQASQANAGIGPNVSIGPMGSSIRAPTMNAGIGTTSMRMPGPAQGLSTSLPPRYGEEPQKAHVSYRFADYNRSVRPGPGLPPYGTLSAYGQSPVSFSTLDGKPPVGFSTPQQGVIPGSSQGLKRKQMREQQIPHRDSVRRRLDLEDEEDIDEGPCRCMERLKRYRKRMRCPCSSYQMDLLQRPLRCYNPYYL